MTVQQVEVAEVGPTAFAGRPGARATPEWPLHFLVFKRVCDIHFAMAAMPMIAILWAVLLVLNPFLNPGPVFFRQERMGRDGVPFRIWKFRTMTGSDGSSRAHDEPLEEHRVTSLGAVLRRVRLDELPNFINVLRGEMSLIGPRPDVAEHARAFSGSIPFYDGRFRVRPGITGLAQVRHGYADHETAVRRKAVNDHIYVERAGIGLDLHIIRRTVAVMLTGFGAR